MNNNYLDIEEDEFNKLAENYEKRNKPKKCNIDFEKKKIPLKKIIDMQLKKTGKLFGYCSSVPAIINNSNIKKINTFETIGSDLGLLFQISDDLIDYKGDSIKVGKKTKKDNKLGKATLISLLGYKKTVINSEKLKKKFKKK